MFISPPKFAAIWRLDSKNSSKDLDEAKTNIFKAAVYPTARYYSDDEKLDWIKKQLITAIISQLPEPQALVDDFVSATYSRMTFKSDPFVQAILDQLLEIARQREPQIFVRIFKDCELINRDISTFSNIDFQNLNRSTCSIYLIHVPKEGESLLVQVSLNGQEIYRQAQAGKSFSEFKHDHFMIQTTTRRLVSLIAGAVIFNRCCKKTSRISSDFDKNYIASE